MVSSYKQRVSVVCTPLKKGGLKIVWKRKFMMNNGMRWHKWFQDCFSRCLVASLLEKVCRGSRSNVEAVFQYLGRESSFSFPTWVADPVLYFGFVDFQRVSWGGPGNNKSISQQISRLEEYPKKRPSWSRSHCRDHFADFVRRVEQNSFRFQDVDLQAHKLGTSERKRRFDLRLFKIRAQNPLPINFMNLIGKFNIDVPVQVLFVLYNLQHSTIQKRSRGQEFCTLPEAFWLRSQRHGESRYIMGCGASTAKARPWVPLSFFVVQDLWVLKVIDLWKFKSFSTLQATSCTNKVLKQNMLRRNMCISKQTDQCTYLCACVDVCKKRSRYFTQKS